MANVAEHVEAVEQTELVARDEIGLLDQIGRADRLGPEPQVRHGHRAGLLRVVDEVPLGVEVGLVADDLDRRLVRPDGPVAAQRVEHRRPSGLFEAERVVDVEAESGHVVDDAHGETALRCVRCQFVEHRLGHGRRELLGSEPVATADDAHARPLGFGHGGDDILEERLAGRSGLLATVEHRNRANRVGERVEQGIDREGPEEPDRGQPDLLTVGDQLGDRLTDGTRARTHHHDHTLGVGGTLVVDEAVAATGASFELGEHVGDDAGHGVVEPVGRFASLEEDVRVLRGATHHRRRRSQPAQLVGGDVVVADQRAQVVVAEQVDAVDLV